MNNENNKLVDLVGDVTGIVYDGHVVPIAPGKATFLYSTDNQFNGVATDEVERRIAHGQTVLGVFEELKHTNNKLGVTNVIAESMKLRAVGAERAIEQVVEALRQEFREGNLGDDWDWMEEILQPFKDITNISNRRNYTATLEFEVSIEVSGSAPWDLDESDIEKLLGRAFGDIEIPVTVVENGLVGEDVQVTQDNSWVRFDATSTDVVFDD